MSPNTPIMNAEVDSYTILQLSQMALDQAYEKNRSGGQVDDDMTNLTSTTCTSLSYKTSLSSSSQLSGWGSAVSRKSYACLRKLEEDSIKADLQKQQYQQRQQYQQQQQRFFGQQQCHQLQQQQAMMKQRQMQHISFAGDSWGYFVDTPDY